MKNALILGIESSCDETAASVVRNGREVLSNVISSQVPLHTLYGGVVPEIASRKHVEKIIPVVKEALKGAGVTWKALDGIAVTYGPGLVGAVLIGVSAAKAMAYAAGLPLIPVNHMAGHVSANFLCFPELEPPFTSLIVSGGHTHLVEVEDYGKFQIIGETRDDAAGEAFDKVARAVGLGYPGGPKIDKAAKSGNEDAIVFPRAKVENSPYDFSFSGLKSAVLNYLNHEASAGRDVNVNDLAASFQKAVVETLAEKTIHYCKESGTKKLALCGGVASNRQLRKRLSKECERLGISFYVPEPVYCTDNGAMIASAGYYEYRRGVRADLTLNAVPNLNLGEEYGSDCGLV